MKKDAQTNGGVPASVAKGVLICGVLSLIGMFVVTYLLSKEKLLTDHMGHATMIVLMVSVLAGSFCATMLAKNNLLLVSLSTGAALMFLFLAVTAVFFEGQYTGIPVTCALVMGCCLASALVATKMLNRTKTYHRKR